jgi:hypothetical protein
MFIQAGSYKDLAYYVLHYANRSASYQASYPGNLDACLVSTFDAWPRRRPLTQRLPSVCSIGEPSNPMLRRRRCLPQLTECSVWIFLLRDSRLGLPCNGSEVMFRAHRKRRGLALVQHFAAVQGFASSDAKTERAQMPTEEYEMAVESQKSPGECTEEMGQRVWLEHDPVVQLREWASDITHPLPETAIKCVIGSDGSADIRLGEPGGRVSRRHARLVSQDNTSWVLEDLDSKNGSLVSGASVSRAPVTPGAKIGIGAFTLVPENQTMIRLRRYFGRFFGWDRKGRDAVDTALQALRAAATQHVPLSLVGVEDTVFIAHGIHRNLAAPDAPFVICSPAPRKADRWLRGAIMLSDLEAGLQHVDPGGMVCCRALDPPAGYERLPALANIAGWGPLQVVSASTSDNFDVKPPSIFVPPLANRSLDEIERIVDECAADALQELGAAPASFTEEGRAWITRHASSTFAKIELSTLRIIARNDSDTTSQAAVRLGLSHVSLGGWLKRYRPPTKAETARPRRRRRRR